MFSLFEYYGQSEKRLSCRYLFLVQNEKNEKTASFFWYFVFYSKVKMDYALVP